MNTFSKIISLFLILFCAFIIVLLLRCSFNYEQFCMLCYLFFMGAIASIISIKINLDR